MHDPSDEPNLEELDTRGHSALTQRIARLDHLQPPAELDRIVLARAGEAIQADTPPRYYRTPRWALPFALAATLVLVGAVLLAVHLGMPRRLADRLSAAAPQPAQESATAQGAAAIQAPSAAQGGSVQGADTGKTPKTANERRAAPVLP